MFAPLFSNQCCTEFYTKEVSFSKYTVEGEEGEANIEARDKTP